MKHFSFAACSLISLLCLLSACKKESTSNNQVDAIVLDLSEGFLTTKTGFDVGGYGDTVCIRPSASSYQVAASKYGAVAGGFLKSADDFWFIESGGPGVWYIRSRKYNYYLGFQENSLASYDSPWAKYGITLDALPTNRNHFVPNMNGNKFVIQPVDNKALYLNTTPQNGASANSQPLSIYFLNSQQEFFFLKTL